jgi:hypothetical protein
VNPVHYNVYRADNRACTTHPPTFEAAGSPFVDETVVNNETYYTCARRRQLRHEEKKHRRIGRWTPVGPVRVFQDDFESDSLDQWTIVQ